MDQTSNTETETPEVAAEGAESGEFVEGQAFTVPASGEGEALIVDVDGFEGPLDLLLVLARTQKVDLKKISILALAEQYLAFVAEARRRKLELAADYLVMAAWLAYLKSKLLLPEPEEEEGPSGEELAARLAFQLQRLEAMREAAARLMARNRLGRDVFARGMPEGIRVIRRSKWEGSLYELLKAYADQRVKKTFSKHEIRRPAVFSVEDARHRLERMLGKIEDWGRLESFLPEELQDKVPTRSAMASTLVATLELVRDGVMEVKQLDTFGPIFLRRRRDGVPASNDNQSDPEENGSAASGSRETGQA